MSPVVYTIGHSNRSLDEVIEMLHAHLVTRVVDVRGCPYSAHVPHFNKENLAVELPRHAIQYTWEARLAGRRRPVKTMTDNDAWRNASFRGYADYLQQPEFEQGLQHLLQLAGQERVAYMCAEAVPWRCHRNLISDVLTARGITVYHIMNKKTANEHKMIPFAVVDDSVQPPRVTYPASADTKQRSWDPHFESAKKRRQRERREARKAPSGAAPAAEDYDSGREDTAPVAPAPVPTTTTTIQPTLRATRSPRLAPRKAEALPVPALAASATTPERVLREKRKTGAHSGIHTMITRSKYRKLVSG